MGRLILASGSPRRIEILRQNGYDPLILPADVDESLPLFHGMTETVLFLALKKARAAEKLYLQKVQAASLAAPGVAVATGGEKHRDGTGPAMPGVAAECGAPDGPALILAADTIVAHRGQIMGKPVDREDGFRMLSALRGDVHQVVTGVALAQAGQPWTRMFYEVTQVYFKTYSDEALWAYLDTDEAYDKAGGYAIQGAFGQYIDHIEGDYHNVVGLPWARVATELQALGYFPDSARQ